MTAAAARLDPGSRRRWRSGADAGAFSRTLTGAPIELPSAVVGPPSTVSDPEWFGAVETRLRELGGLGPNWDQRGSAAVRSDALVFAHSLLQQVMLPIAPLPAIVPLGHGGILLVWSGNAADIEVEVVAPHEVVAYHLDKQSGTEREWTVAADFSSIAQVVRSVTGV